MCYVVIVAIVCLYALLMLLTVAMIVLLFLMWKEEPSILKKETASIVLMIGIVIATNALFRFLLISTTGCA